MNATAAAPTESADELARFRRFGEALDTIRRRVEAQIGVEDVVYLRRLDRFSRAMEIAGRSLIHFSFEPFGFGAGVLALWIHKQLQATEIGHTALHGCYDDLPGAERYHSKKFSWDMPIDEESWRSGHNVKHHQYTNVAGKDPDVSFGMIRLTEYVPWRAHHRFQLPTALLVTWPNFGFVMNLHFTGVNDIHFRENKFDLFGGQSLATVAEAYGKALRKYLPYYLKNYVFFPLLAGPFFAKVLLGNWLAETMRDLYSAATIYCGHIDVAEYPEGTRAHGRGQWYAMQVEATHNFEVSRPLSNLCGGLDHQIEHHLFPRLTPERLRQIAPEVKQACEEHGVRYSTASWGTTLKKALKRVAALGKKGGVRALAEEV